LTVTTSNYSEGRFQGERGTEIYYRVWKPSGKIRAAVVVTHGQGEHSGRYQYTAERFVHDGFSVWATDLRGHGKSGGGRGHVEKFDDYLADVHRLIEKAREDNTQIKPFLLGHSLGGLIVLDYAEKMGSSISGVIATAPLLRLKMQMPPWKVALGKMLSNLAPTMSMKTGLDPNLLSHDQEVVQNYVNDPLVHGVASTRFFTELMRAVNETLQSGANLTIPCLVMVGSGDGIVDSSTTQKFFNTIASSDKTLKVYDGLYHEILNEPEKNTILEEISGWISARI
jgi:lysophospholipase